MDYEDAIRGILWYNGLYRIVYTWKDLKEDRGVICHPDNYNMPKFEDDNSEVYGQLQFLWMLAVELFGDYGTSPRFGWIEKTKEFKEWIEAICKDCFEYEEQAASMVVKKNKLN